MKLSKPIKIIIGLLTAWELILPFLFFAAWFFFIFSIAAVENQAQPNGNALPAVFLPIFPLLICSSFLLVGLHAFHIVHIILNKSGVDVIRAFLGVGMLLFPILAMPVYYFIYILSDDPPKWALDVGSGHVVTYNPNQPNPLPPSQ